jgi:hypothetical protein
MWRRFDNTANGMNVVTRGENQCGHIRYVLEFYKTTVTNNFSYIFKQQSWSILFVKKNPSLYDCKRVLFDKPAIANHFIRDKLEDIIIFT